MTFTALDGSVIEMAASLWEVFFERYRPGTAIERLQFRSDLNGASQLNEIRSAFRRLDKLTRTTAIADLQLLGSCSGLPPIDESAVSVEDRYVRAGGGRSR